MVEEEVPTPEAPKAETGGSKPPKDFMGMLDYYFVKKAPFQIPDNAKEWIVKYCPWITLVLIVLSLPALLAIIGFSALALPFAGAYATTWGLATIFLVVQLGLEIVALPGLFARKKMGWTLLFYSIMFSFVTGLVNTVMGNFSSIFGALIGLVIGLYVLFQIRPLYK